MEKVKDFPYCRQSINAEDIEAVSKVFEGDFLTRGPLVEQFEHELAEYCGTKYAVAFNSGTSALMAACHAAQLNSNDRVFTTPNTFVATTLAIIKTGATPVFLDIDRSTGNLDLNQLELNLDHPRTRGRDVILPVHFAGIPLDMEKVDRMIKDPETVIIEDAAHALGSTYTNGSKVGSCVYSDMTIFSFHPAKAITTGEGGMVTTNDPELYHRLKRYRNNGIEPGGHDVVELTGNFNFTDIQAALGISQLKRLDQFVEKRRELVAHYREQLKDVPHIRMMSNEFDAHTAFHLFVVQIDFEALDTTRTEFMEKLKEKGITTQAHYIPVYQHSFFTKENGDLSDYFPEMETYHEQALSLPLYVDLSKEDVNHIVGALKDLF